MLGSGTFIGKDGVGYTFEVGGGGGGGGGLMHMAISVTAFTSSVIGSNIDSVFASVEVVSDINFINKKWNRIAFIWRCLKNN